MPAKLIVLSASVLFSLLDGQDTRVIEKNVYLREGQSSGDIMVCKSTDGLQVGTVAVFHKVNGAWHQLFKDDVMYVDKNVSVDKSTIPTGKGQITINSFNSGINTGYYKSSLFRGGKVIETCIWNVSLLDENRLQLIVHNQIPDVETYTWADVDSYVDVTFSQERFKAIRIRCGVSKYVMDARLVSNVEWYHSNDDVNVNILHEFQSRIPFQKRSSVFRTTRVEWTDLFIPERVAGGMRNGIYVCASFRGNLINKIDKNDILEVRKVNLLLDTSNN